MSEPSKEASGAIPPKRNVFVTGRRMVACLLDCALVAILSFLAFAPLLLVRPRLVVVLVLLLLFVLLICVFYFTYLAAFEDVRRRAAFWGW